MHFSRVSLEKNVYRTRVTGAVQACVLSNAKNGSRCRMIYISLVGKNGCATGGIGRKPKRSLRFG